MYHRIDSTGTFFLKSKINSNYLNIAIDKNLSTSIL